MKTGKLYLIGAGPGDPGLITLKAVERIKRADVVVYDYLSNEKFLSYAKKGAEIIYVGKMGGNHTLSQWQINELIIKKAKEGKTVARLKGGDPFIFGRGGEEAEEIVQAGIDYEVVPGVTAGAAAAAYAGIPLTHRDFTTTVAFITGHEDPTKPAPECFYRGDESYPCLRPAGTSIYWDKISTGIGTLVFYMGIGNLEPNMKKLIENGRSPDTPAALIRCGTTSQQETLVGTIADIAEKAKAANFKAPAITVVGGVVSLRNKLRWFDKKPLFGKKIVVTRSREQASDFAELLEVYGADVVQFPTIDVVPPKTWKGLDSAIKRINTFNWIVFTSVNGVKYFVERLKKNKKDLRDLKGIKVCAIGPSTAAELITFGITPDFIPKEYRAEGIIKGIGKGGIKGKKILIPRAEVAREILPEELKKKGAKVTVAIAYRSVKPKGNTEKIISLFRDKKIAMVTFTSSSTVKNFVEMFGKEDYRTLLNEVKIASIGPITAKTASELGIKTDIMPKAYTIPALTEAIVKYYKGT